MTVGGISIPALFHAWKEQVVGGIGWELMTELARAGWAALPDVSSDKSDETMYVQVNSFAAARMMDIYLHHDIFDTVCDHKSDSVAIESVLACSKEGVKAFKSKVFIDCTGDADVSAWSGAAFEIDGFNSMSRSRADIEGRESVMRLVSWMRKNVKGAERAEPIFTCPQEWPRESRRVRGGEYVTIDDYISGKKYKDGVCLSYYPVYIHKSSAELLETMKIPENIVPSIPAGALIPQKVKNLLVAGRCISGDRLRHKQRTRHFS